MEWTRLCPTAYGRGSELTQSADSVEKLHGLTLGPVRRGHSTLGEVAIVDPESI